MASHLRIFVAHPLLWTAAASTLLMLGMAPVLLAASSKSAETTDDNAALFDRLDANHNGTLEADEITPENRAFFDRLIRRGDANHDQVLSRQEFSTGLAPTRPEKPIEAKESTTVPGANAVRYLLLSMDINRNGKIEKDEVPKDLKQAFDFMVERLDKNGNGSLERQELGRGGPAMGAIATRYVQRMGIDVDAELAKLKKSQGDAFDRFEQRPIPIAEIRDPKQAKKVFAQMDENGDGKLDPNEVPDPLREPIQRLVRLADRDGDGKLSEAEFLGAREQIARFMKRRQGDEMPLRKGKNDRKESAKSSTTAKNN
jgi:Ca2+-binding EF-hand superfamily protein